MKTLKLPAAWILICTVIAVSNGSTEHASPHHSASHHGENNTQERVPNTIIPFGIQIPEHVLSTQDVACISADNNIFQIMDEAQKACNGTDMRCTFYHFVNHGYDNIGTLDINKELFDDLLMKFDNWLLTAESIDKTKVHGKAYEHTASIHVNERYKNEVNVHNSSDDDKVHNHHITNQDDTHHKIHHHKNENHINLDTEHNNQHSYFEVFIPKDKETGKPRTIYIEVDRDKNEFVLLDEDIDKKLNGFKPIKIELDELSGIADMAFNNIVKSVHHNEHYNQVNYDGRILASDVNTNSSVDDHEIQLDIELDEPAQNISNLFVCNPNICNINANQQLIPDNTTGNVRKIINVSKNLVVPNKYINHAQFHIESQVDNAIDIIPNTNTEIPQNINETDFHDAFMIHEKNPFDTIVFDHNNITDLDMDNEKNSSIHFIELPYGNEDGNLTENYEFSNDNKNVTYDDKDFVELTENNDTSKDIDSDDAQDYSSPNIVHLTEPVLQHEKPVKENKLETTPYINAEPKLTSSLTAAISDYTSSKVDAIISENRQENTDFNNQHPGSSLQTTQYTAVPILEKDIAKVIKTDSHLQSSFPVHATFDLPASDSQNLLSNSDFEHPTINSQNLPLGSVLGDQNTGLKIPQYTSSIFLSPPVECSVRLNKDSKYSPSSQDFISSLQVPNKDFSGSPESLSTGSFKDTFKAFQSAPSLSEPYLTTTPFHLEPNTLISPKYTIFPSKLDLVTPNFERTPTTTPLSASSNSPIDATNSPCPSQILPPYIQPNKGILNLKYSPIDNNLKETMIPCAANINRYPYNTIPYFLNPYLTPPQFIPQYLEPLAETPLQPTPKIPPVDLPISLEQSHLCPNADVQRETKPIPLVSFAPNTPFSPLNPLLYVPGFYPNTSPNIWSNIPYQSMSCLPYTILPDQSSRNYPSVLSNYLAPTIDLRPNQIHEPFLSKYVPKSVLEHPCLAENIMQGTPSSYTAISPVYTRPVQMEFSPSAGLERDLQSLSFKYGIPLSKILNFFEADLSGSHSKTSSPILEIPYSKLEHDSYPIGKSTLSVTNEAINDENRSPNEEILLASDNLTPFDSSLVSLHLEKDALLGSNDSQTYTVLTETTGPLNAQHTRVKNQQKNIFHDSSLIGPHLATISTNDFKVKDEDRIGNEELHTGSDSSISIPLDSSLIGPHLIIGSTPVVLDYNISQGEINTSHTGVPTTSSSQNKDKINQNVSNNEFLDSSLKGPHLPTLYPAKPLLSKHIQITNEMTPLESDLTGLTPLDTSHEDVVTKLEQLEMLQHEKQADTSSAGIDGVHESMTAKGNFIEGELLLESDSSKLMPLDYSLIGPQLQTGILPTITNSDDKSISLTSHNSIQNTNIKDDELESIILPSSLLPTLLDKPGNVDLNLKIHTQDTQMNEDVNELSLESNIELPITDIASIKPSLKETDFQVVEPTLEAPESTTLKLKLKSPDIIHSELQLDSSLIGPSLVHKMETSKISPNLDSSIPLDSSSSLLQETDFREMSTILDTADNLETYIRVPTVNQNKKPLKNSLAIDSKVQFDSSLTGPSLYHEMKPQNANTFDLVTHLDNSLVGTSHHEDIESSVTQSVLEDYSQLYSSLKGSKQEMETKDISHAFKSKNVLDSSLLRPHLLTAPFSSNEIKTINEELQTKLDHTIFKPLDSSLVGPYLDFASQLDESEISRYQNTDSSNLIVGESPLRSTVSSSVISSDLQALLSKFTKAITKSHLSASEIKPCDKLLSSIAKISSDNKSIQPCDDFQTVTFNNLPNTPLSIQDEVVSELNPITQVPEQDFSHVHSIIGGQPCFNSNLFPIPMTFTEYAKKDPAIPFPPISPFVNWVGPPLNIQNVLQISPGCRPVVENTPLSFISKALLPLPPEDFKLVSDLASQSHMYPQSYNPNMYKPSEAIAPSSEWNIPSIFLPVDKYIPLHPTSIKSSSCLPSNLKSTFCDSEYNPIVVDVTNSLLDQHSFQLPQYKSMLPFLAPSLPKFKDEIVSPSFLDTIPISNTEFIKSRPVLPSPMTNKMVQSSIDLYNPQPFMTQTPYISPYNLQPYSNTPLEAQFSQIIGPAPELKLLPFGSPIKFIEFLENPVLEKKYLQQLLSKPFLDSPKVLPSSTSDALLKLPTTSNELNCFPYQLEPVSLTPISPTLTIPSSNAFTSSILPSYVNPLSVSYANAKSTQSTSLPSNVPSVASPFTSPSFSINPYTSSPPLPECSCPLLPVKKTITDYPYLPTEANNRLIPSADPYKPCQAYSRPYLPIYPPSPSIDSTPSSPTFMNEFTTALASPYFPAYNHLKTTPCLRPILKPLTHVVLPAYSDSLTPVSPSSMGPTQTGPLSPSYASPDISYQPLPDLIESLKRPSNSLSPACVSPMSQESLNLPPNIRYLPNFPSNSISIPNPQITKPELQLLGLLNTLPSSYVNNPISNPNQRLPTSTNILPIQNYPMHVPKSSPLSNSQIKQNIPFEHVKQSNLQTSPLTAEVPFYNVMEDNFDKDDEYYEEPNLKFPLEYMSYTLAPEEMDESFNDEDFMEVEDVITTSPITSLATEPSLQTKVNYRPCLTPYSPLYGKPCLAQPFLSSPSFIETIQQNNFDNIPLMPSPRPLEYPVSQPVTFPSNLLLKSPTAVTSANNLPILPYSCIDTSVNPFYILPMNKKASLPSSYYSTTGVHMLSSHKDPRVLRNMTSPTFFHTPINPRYATVPATITSPISQPPASPYISNHFGVLPPTYVDPKSKTLQDSLAKSSSTPSQYAAPMESHFSHTEQLITPQYVTPVSPTQNVKYIKPFCSPERTSSITPVPTILQESVPLNEASIHYQSYVQPNGLTSSAINNFKSPLVTSPYTVSSTFNYVDEPVSTDLNKSQWMSSVTPQYSLPKSLSTVPTSSPTIPFSNKALPVTYPLTTKQVLTNHIIPSSLFTIPDRDIPTASPKKSLSHLQSISRHSLAEPLEEIPYYTTKKSPLFNGKYTDPMTSLPYLNHPLDTIDSHPVQPSSQIQYTAKSNPKLSPVLAQYATPSSSSSYASIPLETLTNRQVYKTQYSLPNIPIHNAPSYSSPLGKNPFMNSKLKPIQEVPAYPVSNNIVSSPKITPFDSILLSNLRSLDISQGSPESYSSPITSSVPLHSSSLSKLLEKTLLQKSRQYHPQIIPNYSQYVSELPIDIGSELLPSSSPLLKTPLLTPLLPNSQNNAQLLPIDISRLTAFPNSSPNKYLASSTSDMKYPCNIPSKSLVSEVPEYVTPINSLPITRYSVLKSPFNKQYQSDTLKNVKEYSNYEIQKPTLSMKTNVVNTAEPMEVSAISATESSPLTHESSYAEIIEEIKPDQGLQYSFLPLPINISEQRQFHPAFTSKYATIPQPLHKTSLSNSKYKTSKPRPGFSVPLLIPEEAELIDTKEFLPLSQIKSEPLVADYFPTDRTAPKLIDTPSVEPDISQFFPYTTLLNIDLPSSSYKQLPPQYQTPHFSNQIQPVSLSPKEYKNLIQGTSSSQSSSSPTVLASTNTDSQSISSPMTIGQSSVPYYTQPISRKPKNWLQLPIFTKYLPPNEVPLEVAPEKESTQILLNKYRPAYKLAPLGVNNNPYELISSTSEEPLKVKNVKPISLTKSGSNTQYENLYSNDFNEYDSETTSYDVESKAIDINKNKPDNIEAKSFTNILPEIDKGVSVSKYDKMAQRPQRLSKMDHFYTNNHIGKTPQVFNVPIYNTLPTGLATDVTRHSTTVSPDFFKERTNIHTKNSGTVPKLDITSLRPSEFYNEISNSPENVPIINSYPVNYFNPSLKYSSQIKYPSNAIEITHTTEVPYKPISYAPYNNIEDMKYSGYKTYQIPSFKSPKLTQNLVSPVKMYGPTVVPYFTPISSGNPINVQKIPSPCHCYSPTETFELDNSQYQTIDISTPVQNKLGLKTLQESPELHECDPLIPHYQNPVYMSTPLQSKLGLRTLQESPEINEYDPLISQHQTTVDMTTPRHTKLDLQTLQERPELNEYDHEIPQYQTPLVMTVPLPTELDLKTLQESPELNEYGPLIPQYQSPVATPLQPKFSLNTLPDSSEYDEYNPTEDVPISAENTNEENDLKTNLINFINKREDIKNNINNKNDELTIPIGNIAVTKKESHNANTIETNNPSIGLKVWKSNVKIAQAELKLKFKDLSVNNFMPVVNNLDKYDMEEVLKIVKNYIDEKYGAHIEVNEPYTVNNKYAVIKGFDYNAENKYNLLWPANYV